MSDIAVEATPPASAPSLRGAERELRVGTFLYLVCLALVAAATIGVFFGVGLYSLGQQPKEIISESEADQISVVPSGGGKGTPFSTRVPATAAASVAALTATTASALSASQGANSGAVGAKPAPMAQSRAVAQTLGASADQGRGPIEGHDDGHSESKRFGMASTEIVSGTVIQVSDAMTWIIGDETVHLWGIRPGGQRQAAALEKVVDWARSKGPVECRRQPHSSRYRCSTATGEDIAQATLLAGIGRVVGGATLAYRNAEAQGRRRGKVP